MSSDEGPGWSGMFARLKAGLTRTATVLSSGLTGLLTKQRLDAETIEALEEALIRADLGADLAHASGGGDRRRPLRHGNHRERKSASISRLRSRACCSRSARPFIVDACTQSRLWFWSPA